MIFHLNDCRGQCNICDPAIHDFFNERLDPNLFTGKSLLGGLFRLYEKIKATPESDDTRINHLPSSAATRVVRKRGDGST